MTRWGGHVVGRISLAGAVVAVMGVLAAPGVEAQRAPSPVEVTIPPVTLPPVDLPPLTVPPAVTDPLPPAIGDVLDATTGTVDDVVGQVGGLLPGGATVPPVTTPTVPPSTPPPTDPVSGARPDPDDSGAGTVGGAGGTPSTGPDGSAATAEDDSGSTGTPAPRRALRRLASSGASLNAVDLPLAPADPLDDAVQRDARHFGWPVVLGLLIVAFLAFQHRADRHERKLADAPLDQGERLRFK